ncbi:hypothetical protein DYH09_11265 [bacterium CPR1]|nr:hypothetical protein [bacterium CPR1]
MLLALVSVLSAFLALALCEVVLQVVDYPPALWYPWDPSRETGYKFAPHLNQRMISTYYDVAFKTNSLGLRDREIGPKQGQRIVLLGDSYTAGHGVEQSEIFADLLEQKLGVEVVNCGVGGWELIHQLHFARAHLAELKPDLVVLALFLGNDVIGNLDWESRPNNELISRVAPFPTNKPRELKLKLLFDIYRFRQRVLRGQVRKGRDWEPPPAAMRIFQRQPESEVEQAYRETAAILPQLKAEIEKNGARFLVVFFSERQVVDSLAAERWKESYPGFDQKYDLLKPERFLEELCQREQIPYLNLNPALRALGPEKAGSLYFRQESHFNRDGHRFVAEQLEPEIQSRLRTR